jgi:hypothetical protein
MERRVTFDSSKRQSRSIDPLVGEVAPDWHAGERPPHRGEGPSWLQIRALAADR